MKLRIAKKILKNALINEKCFIHYKDETIMRAIKRVNPSIWANADRTYHRATFALCDAYKNLKINKLIHGTKLNRRLG